MRRSILVLVLVGLLASACATGASGPDATGPNAASSSTTAADSAPPDTTEGGGDTGQEPPSDSTPTTQDTTPPPDGEPARDFSLAIGVDQTEQFVLSQEVKPVFMVFWAEW